MQGTLMEMTRELLRESNMSIPDLHAELKIAGIQNITYYWLRKFSAGGMNDPSVNKVQALYEFLIGRPLIV